MGPAPIRGFKMNFEFSRPQKNKSSARCRSSVCPQLPAQTVLSSAFMVTNTFRKTGFGLCPNLAPISPTHKRTEGRAPVWGSEFTTKDAALQGGFSKNRSYAEHKIMGAIPGFWNSQST
jgi:hypothetical protein